MVPAAALLALLAPRAETPPSWPFAPAAPKDAPLLVDLTRLNERVAGETGYVRRSPDGNAFVLGDGKPVRFWCVNSFVYRDKPEEMEVHCAFLARLGVNMVRLHASLTPKRPGSGLTDVDADEIARIQRWVSVAKRHGIYTTISPFWANGGHAGTKASWGLAGLKDGEDFWGRVFFDGRLQSAYRGWIRALYEPKNPYTGIPLAKDPAVAIAQIQNEDSLFFWTVQGMRPAWIAELAGRYGEWLKAKYGTLPAATKAWDGATVGGDDLPNGKVALTNVYAMTQPQTGGMARRVRDETEFFARLQRGFYDGVTAFMRRDLGMKTLVNAGNWTTASPERLGDLERWTYLGGDVIATNRYTNGGLHLGPNSSWRTEPGHDLAFEDPIRRPDTLPFGLRQPAGYPMMVTEGGWVTPMPYVAEAPLLVASYGALTGLDGFFWFSTGVPGFLDDPYFPYQTFPLDGVPAGRKAWTKFGLDPLTMASFPAAALAYRTGAFREAPPALSEGRADADLFDRTPPALVEGKAYDPNRVSGPSQEGQGAGGEKDPRTFLLGPVVARMGPDAKSGVAVRGGLPKAGASAVTSLTGEQTLDPANGLFLTVSPTCVGAAGRIGTQTLGPVTLTLRNPFGCVTVVSLDGKPLTVSRRVLVQTGTRIAPTGWRTEPAEFKREDGKSTVRGERVADTGTTPWRVESASGTLTIANPNLRRATVADVEGRALRPLPVVRSPRLSFDLPPDALYVVLEG